ncbi:MAG: 4-alpha-glucanotransferase [Rhodocyclales bacterium GWA2_65_20]|nr:MAG: 4-alpha-glucanotransferase [Rhodocyclales bacterium GWA2_65_20]
MKPQQALDRLCALAGIAVEYQDVWGRTRIAGDDAKRALLAALGIACDSPAAVTAASEELEERDWRRALPPVLVLRQSGQPWHVPVTLPGTWRGRQLHWQLQLEGGELRQGTAAVNDLARLAERRIDRVRTLRLALPLPADLDLGYHRFNLLDAGLPGPPDLADAGAAAMTLIVAPERCYLPPALDGRGRVWGPQVQLYTLRSQRNWGIGDFTDLHRLVEWAAANGAGVVGINPLHALFPDAPENASPYGPSSRSGWNPLYLDVEAIPEFAASLAARARVQEEGFQAGLQALRATALVDYAGVAAAKQPVLELLFAQFRQEPPAGKRGSAFAAYCAESGAALRNLARFEALQAHFRRADASVWGWPAWPQEYRDPASAAVAEFCRDHAEQVQFRQYLQWETERQLAGVGRRSWELGLGVGLYLDLAVGVDPGGAEVWAERALYATAAGIGAPPDAYNLAGQDWGLAPPLPQRLRDAAYAPWIAAVRANMRHAGALRIDHVMGLARQFWVPRGFPPDQGAYVAFPLRDLFGIVALESRRNSCLVVGEDLGTVPEEVRRTLVDSGGLSCRPLYFERNGDDGFGAPDAYPAQAVASVGSHDLPPLRGYWQGRDLELRDQLKLFATPQERERLVLERAADRARLLVALEREGLLPAASGVDPVAVPSMTLELCRAVHAYLARAPARILAVAGEDMLDQAEQVNLPGVTAAHHPNWRRKLDCALEDWGTDARVAALVEVLRQARGAGVFPRAQGLPGAGAAGAAARIPLATYRIQLNREFTLAQAAALVPYWHALGISHCYASPYLMARAGSSHGYDITDHAAINPEIGSDAELARWVAALHAHGMGQIVDVVPNHMGVLGGDNPWWQDVLENGEASPHARYFDIDWQPLKEELRGKVLLPVLGAPYGQVLEGGELALAFDAARGELALHYYGHRFPVDPHTYPQVLGRGIERLAAQLGAAHPDLLALQFLLDACGHLPPHGASAPALVAERQRDKEVLKLQLAALAARNPAVARFVAANVAACNGNAGQPASWDALHELIKSQAWRLAYWRVAADDINYRRFFDINDLAALRMEDEAVFRDTHRLLGEWLAAGYVDGLRIDHPDGLYDPAQYFERLQRLAADSGGAPAPLYVVAEKILAAHERLPQSWPIFGTTGYRFANLVNGLFVDAANERRIDRIHAAFIGGKQDFAAIAYRAKRLIMGSALAGELNVLANQLSRIALAGRASCDFTVNGLRAALREVVASFPVYRTYVTPAQLVEDDSRYIDWAVAVAKKRSRAADVSVFDFVGAVLSGTVAAGRSAEEAAAVHAFAMKFQQYTGPVAAKGIEDTAFYRYHRLVSLNEVGSDPRSFGVSPAAFHAASQEQALRWPHTLLATSTHDSKRSEDVRARIDVISELPAEWLLHLRRWRRANRGKKRLVDGQPAPTANDEYLLYQTLLGVWPLEDVATDATALEALHRRVAAYMLKAAREAKLTTGWLNPNREYEQALADFIAALFAAGRKNLFLADFLPFQQRVARFGLVNSLAQTLIKLVAPGVPDIYQGNELWNFSLVDPDNRRAVDYALRQAALADLLRSRERHGADLAAWARTLAGRIDDGRIKLYLTWCGLQLRRRLPELFQGGMYLPLRAQGAHAAHVCAFARRSERHAAIVIAPRLVAGLAPDGALPLGSAVWSDTWLELPADLAGTQFTNVCTGEHGALQERDGGAILTLAAALKNFPVALYADSGLD